MHVRYDAGDMLRYGILDWNNIEHQINGDVNGKQCVSDQQYLCFSAHRSAASIEYSPKVLVRLNRVVLAELLNRVCVIYA